jgi:Spy/CpxP family protein refolding chaperone
MDVAGHQYRRIHYIDTREASMETTGTREEQTTVLCRIMAMPVKHRFSILALVLIFMALCVVVFAEEPGAPDCDLQSGLAAALNLSQAQCESLRQLTDRFYDDAAPVRNKIVQKRLELKNLSRVPKTDLYVIDKKGKELSALEQELSRRARQTEQDQKKFLTPEQLNKMKNTTSGSNVLLSGKTGYGAR